MGIDNPFVGAVFDSPISNLSNLNVEENTGYVTVGEEILASVMEC
jgi:hypothetical protein